MANESERMAAVPQGEALEGRFDWVKGRWTEPSPIVTTFPKRVWLDMTTKGLSERGLGARNAEYLARLASAWDAHLAARADGAPTVASTFAGCGGSSLGYSMAGFREVLAVEWDEAAAATFCANFPGVPVWRGDVHAFGAAEFLAETGMGPNELDVLDGSPPCQGFSTAGKREFFDPRNQLYNEFARLLRELRPRAFVMENVSGMVKGAMKAVFADATRKMKGAGYRVSVRLLDAQWLGVPQSRKRLIWVGVREDLGVEPGHPEPHGPPFSLADAIWDLLPGDAGQAAPFERADHLRAAENDLHSNEWRSSSDPGPTVTSNRPPVVRVHAQGGGYMAGREWDGGRPLPAGLATSPPSLSFWAANAGRDGRPVEASEPSPPVTTSAPRDARSPGEANPRYVQLQPKLPHHRGEGWADKGRDAGEPSYAVPASAAPWLRTHRGMGFDGEERGAEDPSYSVRAAGPAERNSAGSAREMTPRECARVQSFPDGFAFPKNRRAAYRQIGNSVPPLMMREIALVLRGILAEADGHADQPGAGGEA